GLAWRGTRIDVALPSDAVKASSAAAALAAGVSQANWLFVLDDHDGFVYSAAFSPDGTRIVTASDDKTARIWDAASAKEIAVLRHHDAAHSAAFSPDGSQRASRHLPARRVEALHGFKRRGRPHLGCRPGDVGLCAPWP